MSCEEFRQWRIAVEKNDGEGGLIHVVATITAPTAQEAMKQLVDLTTNNARVERVEVSRL